MAGHTAGHTAIQMPCLVDNPTTRHALGKTTNISTATVGIKVPHATPTTPNARASTMLMARLAIDITVVEAARNRWCSVPFSIDWAVIVPTFTATTAARIWRMGILPENLGPTH